LDNARHETRETRRLASFSAGATSEELRVQFEKDTSLARQSFYNALSWVKKQGWVIGGGPGQVYNLSLDGSWKKPPPSIGERLELAERKADRLEYVVNSKVEQIEDLKDQVESLRDWGNGNSGIAIASLTKIVSNNDATTRQRLRSAATILSYRVEDDEVTKFTKGFLEALCANADIPADYRIEAAEILRRQEAPKVLSETVRPRYNEQPAEPPPIPLRELVEIRRAYCDRVAAELEKQRDPVTGFFPATIVYPETPPDE
jgi:hypothetical protein